MGKYEVTQAQYDCLMGRRKYFTYYFQGYNRPVERTSLNHANNFLHELTLLYSESGLRFRLPTEAEWEYACRAGTTTPFYTGETINDKQANYKAKKVYGKGVKGAYLKRTTDVGSYPPNAFGLFDMHGNVWEWCNDMYMKKYYRSSPTADPVGGGGDEPVRRGGAWDAKPKDCRSADRHHMKLWRHKDNTGFRAVLEIDEMKERNKAETLIPEKNIATTNVKEDTPLKKCDKCGREIGKNETGCIFKTRIVCPDCFKRLSNK
jgi:formylglycine-generating enzyme required for sulfatase activity